ncbi:MAG: hypothetical protein D6719_08805 [Candidatus Dadabacteria bacterium]|nr:MAG: hypothetical protein D6719_08805 [Candidatus Dadabacteria bacterium]
MKTIDSDPGSSNLELKQYLILRNFITSLAHNLRTPLSVISNELAYIQSVLKEHDCEAAIRKCKQISASLSAVTGLVDYPATTGRYSLEEYSYLLISTTENINLKEFCLSINPKQLKIVLESLAEIVAGKTSDNISNLKLFKVTAAEDFVKIELSGENPTNLEPSTGTLISELFLKSGVKNPHILPIIDSILLAHSCKMVISVGKIISINLKLPYV